MVLIFSLRPLSHNFNLGDSADNWVLSSQEMRVSKKLSTLNLALQNLLLAQRKKDPNNSYLMGMAAAQGL